jgi:hypothetical protein
MTPTKVRELEPHTRDDDPNCSICHPKKGRLREDQIWGVCPTNEPHPPHAAYLRLTGSDRFDERSK